MVDRSSDRQTKRRDSDDEDRGSKRQPENNQTSYGRNYRRDENRAYDHDHSRYGGEGSYYRERGGSDDLEDDYSAPEERSEQYTRRGYGRRGRHGESWQGYDREGRYQGTYEQSSLRGNRNASEGSEKVTGPYRGVGPRGYQRSDERIKEEVCQRLTQHGQLDASDIDIDVQSGDVILKGTVDSRRAKRMAEDAVDSIPGVRDVLNQLCIHAPGTTTSKPTLVGAEGRVVGGMDVIGMDGTMVGKVKIVRSSDFLVDRPMARDVFVPFNAARVEGNQVLLNVTASQVDSQDWPVSAPFGSVDRED